MISKDLQKKKQWHKNWIYSWTLGTWSGVVMVCAELLKWSLGFMDSLVFKTFLCCHQDGHVLQQKRSVMERTFLGCCLQIYHRNSLMVFFTCSGFTGAFMHVFFFWQQIIRFDQAARQLWNPWKVLEFNFFYWRLWIGFEFSVKVLRLVKKGLER